MTAKSYLGRAYRLDLNINCQLEQLAELRSLAYKVTSHISENKTKSTKHKSPMENAVIKIVITENEIKQEIDRMIKLKKEIENKISLVKNEEHRILLKLRYICCNSWEQIAVKMGYSYSNVYKQHHYAIKAFEKIYKREDIA